MDDEPPDDREEPCAEQPAGDAVEVLSADEAAAALHTKKVREAAAVRLLAARLARKDFTIFCEYVMRDERTQRPIVLAPLHVEWAQLLDEHERLVLFSHVEAGKTQMVAVARTLWELGNDPTLRCLILSHTQHQARRIATTIRAYVENSVELREVFPDLEPGTPWGEFAFSIKRRSNAKDPSVQVAGVGGNILGARLDRVVADDVLDHDSTRTDDARKATIAWWDATLTGRLTDHAKVRVVGNAHHQRDLLHELARRPGWAMRRFPVVDSRNGKTRWPERWPDERIQQKALELGPFETARQLMCEARDDATARFPKAAIDLALQLGEGTSMASALQVVPPGYRTYTGVDLAVQQKDSSDSTALVTIAVDPYGTRSILNVESGKWTAPEIVQRIRNIYLRYQSIMVVENNASQNFLVQWVQYGDAMPIIPFTTGRNKAHPEHGVESLAVEMAAGKWRIPNHGGRCHREIQGLVDEMLFYDPVAHTGDKLMALWFAREGIRLGARAIEPVAVDFQRR